MIPGEWIAGILALIGAFGAVWGLGRRGAKQDAKVEKLEANAKAQEVRNEVENRIAADRTDPVDRLRERWGRD